MYAVFHGVKSNYTHIIQITMNNSQVFIHEDQIHRVHWFTFLYPWWSTFFFCKSQLPMWSHISYIQILLQKDGLCFLGSLLHVQLHLLKTENMRANDSNHLRRAKQLQVRLDFCHVSASSEAFPHFYNVGRHGFQRDESGLIHVDLLFISDDPGKILGGTKDGSF